MTTQEQLAHEIRTGEIAAIRALNKPELYDALNAGMNGTLPFLGSSTKIDAGKGAGFLTRVLYMQPAKASGRESCGGRSAGCTASCLAEYTGRMSYTGPREARRRRHASFYADRDRFLSDVAKEIAALARQARRKGMIPAVRLNGTTDLPWERYPVGGHKNLMAMFPDVQFYDYTKLALKHRIRRGLPENYHLTFSMSERADADERAREYIDAGFSVAVVFAAKKGELPREWRETQVVDGDKNDARFTDPAGVYVGLSAKGRAKKDTTGFVKNPESE